MVGGRPRVTLPTLVANDYFGDSRVNTLLAQAELGSFLSSRPCILTRHGTGVDAKTTVGVPMS
jgi:hypothetical protein